jgi:putative transposase
MVEFVVPDGCVAQAYRFALDCTPRQARALASHAGAARFAHNHMLALVKAVLDQRAAERGYGVADKDLTPSQGWSLPALRKTWNARKCEYAPWWAENSKEACNTGLNALARGLDAWGSSRRGQRAGARIGFPRFKTRRSRASVRFTTGTIRVEPDRHHVTLPRLGTVTQDSAGRWFCSLQSLVRGKTRPEHEGRSTAAVGAPKSLAAAQSRLRALQRRVARQDGPYDPHTRTRRQPSRRWRRTEAHIGKIHVRAASVRRDVLHKATTALAQRHRVVVVETLNASGMRSRGGAHKRGLNRALADAALAEIRRMLAYKTRWYGSVLVEVDRFYPSSKTCSACGGRKPSLTLADRVFACGHCGVAIDRDLNAAINLARLGEPQRLGSRQLGEQGPAGSGPVAGRGATRKTTPAPAGEAGGCEASTPHNPTLGGRVGQTGTASPQGEAA